MPRPLWPRGLPCPNLKAISYSVDGGELATEMESGSRRTRQLYDTLPTGYTATMTCSRTEAAVFLAFYKKVAGSEFEIEVHSPFRIGQSLTRHRAQFQGLPKIDEFSTNEWTVATQLWLAEVEAEDFDQIAFLATYGDESGRIANLFDQLANDWLAAHVGAA